MFLIEDCHQNLISCLVLHYQTIHELLQLEYLPYFFTDNGPCYGWKPAKDKPFTWISYNDVSTLLFYQGIKLSKHLLKNLKSCSRQLK